MDDIKYLLKKDTAEKKITARSARKKVRHTGCNLPSDRMSKKEINKMNGEVICVNIHKPMTWKHFKKLSNDIQREYLTYLSDEFSCAYSDIAKAFGISVGGFAGYVRRNGLKGALKNNRWKRLKQQEWDVFWSSHNASESLENDCSATNAVDSAETPVQYVDMAESLENNCSAKNAETHVQHVDMAEYLLKTALESNEGNKKPYNACRVTNFTIALRDIRSWYDIPEYLRSIPLSDSNIITMQVAFYGHDHVDAGECID